MSHDEKWAIGIGSVLGLIVLAVSMCGCGASAFELQAEGFTALKVAGDHADTLVRERMEGDFAACFDKPAEEQELCRARKADRWAPVVEAGDAFTDALVALSAALIAHATGHLVDVATAYGRAVEAYESMMRTLDAFGVTS